MTPDKQKEFKLPVDFRGWNLIDRLVAEVLNAKDLDEVDKLKLDCEKEMLAYKNEEVEKAKVDFWNAGKRFFKTFTMKYLGKELPTYEEFQKLEQSEFDKFNSNKD